MDHQPTCYNLKQAGPQPDVNIFMNFWKTLQGVGNLNIECNLCQPLCSINRNSSNNHQISTDRVLMHGLSHDGFIPLRNSENSPSCKKKNSNDGSSSPPHGGKKRKENFLSRKVYSNWPPWVVRNYTSGMVGLHEEIEDFYNFMRPTQEEHNMRQYVIRIVKEEVIKLWPKAKVDVFGSFRTDLYLPTSDIDIVVFGEWDKLPLFTLKQALVNNRITDESSCKVLDRAAVPIIKFQHLETLVKVDISFNVKSGIQSVECIKEYMRKYPLLAKLVFVLKQFLVLRELNEVWTGGVSSYSLILMCVSFLQLHPRAETSRNLGVVLIEFFELYGRHFNYHSACIRVKNGGRYMHKEEFRKQMDNGQTPSLLSIEDPLTPGNDLGRGSYAILQVKLAFEFAYRSLTEAIYKYNPQYPPSSLLNLIVNVTECSIEQRKNALEKWHCIITNNQVSARGTEELQNPPRCSTGSSACSSVSSIEAVNVSIPSFSSCSSEELSSNTDSDSDAPTAAPVHSVNGGHPFVRETHFQAKKSFREVARAGNKITERSLERNSRSAKSPSLVLKSQAFGKAKAAGDEGKRPHSAPDFSQSEKTKHPVISFEADIKPSKNSNKPARNKNQDRRLNNHKRAANSKQGDGSSQRNNNNITPGTKKSAQQRHPPR